MAVVRKFGDEHSNLLDQYERLSFEARLNQAILGRSLSEPRTLRPRSQPQLSASGSVRLPCLVTATTNQPRKGRRGSAFNFNKVINKILKPILERKSKSRAKKDLPGFRNPLSWKALSKSMRL